ncbi:MAG: hypothetical protein HYX32_12800 [Actinobacteria bacterium]|nr:hypothetical protein [Actinomycetota bacterium]
MKVLLTGTDQWVVDRVGQAFVDAGHEVLLCHDDDAPAFPCLGLRGDISCPAHEPADLAVTVRSRPFPQPTRREIAVTCALHHGIPLVVAGRTLLNPFVDQAALIVDGLEDLIEGCEQLLDARRAGRAASGKRASPGSSG